MDNLILLLLIGGISILIVVKYSIKKNSLRLFNQKYDHCPYCGKNGARYFIKCISEEYVEIISRSDEPDRSHWVMSYRTFARCNNCQKEVESNDNCGASFYPNLHKGEIGEFTKEQFLKTINDEKNVNTVSLRFLRVIAWIMIGVGIIMMFIFYH